MSRRGNCRDNAVAESFLATLKVELVHDEAGAAAASARSELAENLEATLAPAPEEDDGCRRLRLNPSSHDP